MVIGGSGREVSTRSPAAAEAAAAVNAGRMFVTLKPLERAQDQRRSGNRAPASASSRGFRASALFLQSAQDLRMGGRTSAAQYQYTLQSDNVRS